MLHSIDHSLFLFLSWSAEDEQGGSESVQGSQFPCGMPPSSNILSGRGSGFHFFPAGSIYSSKGYHLFPTRVVNQLKLSDTSSYSQFAVEGFSESLAMELKAEMEHEGHHHLVASGLMLCYTS